MSHKDTEELLEIGGHDLGIGSGVLDIIDKNIETNLDEYGEYKTTYNLDRISNENVKKILKTTLNANESDSENKIANTLFSKTRSIQFDDTVGYYLDLYAGHVKEGAFRKRGSSGGFVSWMATQLMEGGYVDGFIHVKRSKANDLIFEYGISRTIQEIKAASKSRYYPVELSKVLKEVKERGGTYAIVGIPEIITEVRLLAEQDEAIKKHIKYYIGLVCGHQKSTKYAEAIAWEYGIKPGDLKDIDFRVKREKGRAIDYDFRLTGLVKGEEKTITVRQSEPFVSNWAHGFFKAKFSDFTDNVFNDDADVTFGDAWLDEYVADPKGTNIIIVRNKTISDIIKLAITNEKVALDVVDVDTIKRSQSGLIHHIRDELPYRLYKHLKHGEFVPKKRVSPGNDLSRNRKAVQDVREKIATKSHIVYKDAVARGDFEYFRNKMQKYVEVYNQLYGVRKESAITRAKHRARVGAPITRAIVQKHIHTVANLPRRVREKNADGVILTLTGYNNYGNVIQKYAMQNFLKKHGYNFIAYADPFNSPQSIYATSKKILVKTPIRYAKRILKSRKPYWYVPKIGEIYPDVKANENLINFVNEYVWQKPFNVEDKDEYRNYVVGSDQVWRNWYHQEPFVENERLKVGYYFLNFLENKKTNRVAYAASFGKDKLDGVLSKDFIKYIKPYVEKFNAISVREKSGINIVEKSWGREGVIEVVDPTLLLGASDYAALINVSGVAHEKTDKVFYYILDVSQEKQKLVKRIADLRQDKASGIYPYEEDVLPPVEKWLKGFRDSEFVITDSFHGTVFSIINHTPFLVIGNEDRGLSRLEDLLDSLGLRDRLVLEKDMEELKLTAIKDIDWNKVQELLDKRKKLSAEWLIGHLVK